MDNNPVPLSDILEDLKHVDLRARLLPDLTDLDQKIKGHILYRMQSLINSIPVLVGIDKFHNLLKWITDKYDFIDIYPLDSYIDIRINKKDTSGDPDKSFDPMPVIMEILEFLKPYMRYRPHFSVSSDYVEVQCDVYYDDIRFSVDIVNRNIDQCEIVFTKKEVDDISLSPMCQQVFDSAISRVYR